jgi:hypothetical protein
MRSQGWVQTSQRSKPPPTRDPTSMAWSDPSLVAPTKSDARHSLQFAVNIWQRFQMPAHGRKGPQQILPRRPTYGAPSCAAADVTTWIQRG